MIGKDVYGKLRSAHGRHASWAVWAEPGERPKSNTSDLSVFDDPGLLDILNDKYVFVGLNVSQEGQYRDWSNFHSPLPSQNDYKLRYAFRGTVFWGSYLTDLFKDVPEAQSGKVRESLRKGEIDIDGHIRVLEKELGMLGHPVVIAFGNLVYECLSENLTSFRVVRLRHYSDYCSKERYREEVLELERKLPVRG